MSEREVWSSARALLELRRELGPGPVGAAASALLALALQPLCAPPGSGRSGPARRALLRRLLEVLSHAPHPGAHCPACVQPARVEEPRERARQLNVLCAHLAAAGHPHRRACEELATFLIVACVEGETLDLARRALCAYLAGVTEVER